MLSPFLPSKQRDFAGDEELYKWESEDCWFLAPIGQHRDSETLEKCNFDVQVERLRQNAKEDENFHINRFGHWAVGWVEIVIVKKDTTAYEVACSVQSEIDDYPVLDEELYHEYRDKYDRTEIDIEVVWQNGTKEVISYDIAEDIASCEITTEEYLTDALKDDGNNPPQSFKVLE